MFGQWEPPIFENQLNSYEVRKVDDNDTDNDTDIDTDNDNNIWKIAINEQNCNDIINQLDATITVY